MYRFSGTDTSRSVPYTPELSAHAQKGAAPVCLAQIDLLPLSLSSVTSWLNCQRNCAYQIGKCTYRVKTRGLGGHSKFVPNFVAETSWEEDI